MTPHADTRAGPERLRLWPFRLLEISPIVVLLLILGVWNIVPPVMRQAAFWSAQIALAGGTAGADTPSAESFALEALYGHVTSGQGAQADVDVSPAGQLRVRAADAVASGVSKAPRRLYDLAGRLKPLAIAAGDPLFAKLDAYERSTGSRVAVFVYPAAANPPVAMRAVAATDALTAVELRELESSGTLDTLRRSRTGSKAEILPIDIEGLSGSSSAEDAERSVSYSVVFKKGHVWEIYAVNPREANGQIAGGGGIDAFSWTEIGSAESRAQIEREASRSGGAIFVVGPTDAPPVPLRLPSGMDTKQALELASVAADSSSWRGIASESVPLTSALAARTGATWVTPLLVSGVSTQLDGGPRNSQALLFVAADRSDPRVTTYWDLIGRTPLRSTQVFLSSRLPLALSILGVLLFASLVAAPMAFVAERRLTAEADVERERERVRREAQQRVIVRLSTLSDRVESAGLITSERTKHEIDDVAHDIETTVSDLRDVLGELDRGARDE